MVEEWFLLQSPAGSAAYNMALDEALLRHASERGRVLLRLYSWEKPAVSIGYFQKYPPIDRVVVRRPTGGGIVYHGDDTTFTIVAPPGHALQQMSTTEAYRFVHEAVARAVGAQVQATGKAHGQYECFQTPVAGDVVAGGQKLAGGAQRRNRYGMLHQGSIAAKLPAEHLQRAFGVRFVPYALTPAEVELADRLAREKYATDAWNRRVS